MDLAALIRRQREYFRTGATRPQAFRQGQLRRLRVAIESSEARILAALYEDLRKPAHESYMSEVGLVINEIRHACQHLPSWMVPRQRRLPMMFWPGRASTVHEPLGVALIMGPWNYPFQLMVSPLVSAIAAGNCCILKPSEMAPHTSRVLCDLMGETFSPEFVAAVEGGRSIAENLLNEKFDKIFFTGSSVVGRDVLAHAARHLTPVTLELGGKCPAIVCADASVGIAARRIAWGKFLNAGQTCVAPDFVLVDRKLYEPLLSALRDVIQEFYTSTPQSSPDFGRIVNRRHFDRILEMAGGCSHDASELYIAPTVLGGVSWDDPVMQEEIFGPVLPVIPFDVLDDVLVRLADRSSPLAIYLFSSDLAVQRRVISGTRSGGVCINDTVVHMVGPDLPFGGVGESGMGRYHGRAGFECFSNERTVVRRSAGWDIRFRYPPQKFGIGNLKKACRFLLGS